MNHVVICLLTLLFSLSGPGLKRNADFGHSILAADGGVIQNANYAQTTYSQAFSSPTAPFAGQTVQDMAAALQSGTLNPADVPIQYIVQDGNTLILNTRSAQALEQAGIPRAQWNAVDMTGEHYTPNISTHGAKEK